MVSEGPNNPSTASNDNSIGTVVWIDINNIKASDDSYATCDISGIGVTSNYAKATNFGFSIPTGATINGILVEIERGRDGSSNPANDDEVKIVKSTGVLGSENKAVATDWITEQYISYGGSSDLWSESWTAEDINDVDFGVVVNAISENTFNVKPRIDHIRITVTYTESSGSINPKIKISGTFSTKPIKVKIGGTFVEKTLKVKVSGTFQ